MCYRSQAYRRGYYGPKYVWILLGWYSPARWWEQEVEKFKQNGVDICEVEEIEKVVVGSLSIRGFEIQQNMSLINFNGVVGLQEIIKHALVHQYFRFYST